MPYLIVLEARLNVALITSRDYAADRLLGATNPFKTRKVVKSQSLRLLCKALHAGAHLLIDDTTLPWREGVELMKK